MPTYEYKCKKCGYRFEELQNISDKSLTKCQKSGCTGKVSRIISAGGGFILKGSGFYSTDYRSESYKKAASADKETSSPSSSSKESGEKKTVKKESPGTKSDTAKKDE